MDGNSIYWHSLTVQEALERLGTDSVAGLDESEVLRRINIYGRNEIKAKVKTPLEMFANQFKSILIIILLIATLISAFLGEFFDALTIAIIVFMMAIFGFVQEYRSEKTIQALKKLAVPRARVIRGGREVEIPSTDLVPGDIVLLREGDRVPADIRLIESNDLEVDESPLTGESTPVEKDANVVLDPSTPVSDRVNMVFMGTYIVRGSAKGVVVATGSSTELGRIAKSVAETKEEKTPLEIELDDFGKKIGLIIIGIAAIVFATSLLEGWANVLESFMIAVALAVAAIPEGLPAIATAVLAIGAHRMAKKNALVRKLAAIEALGSVDVICTDKTGTITKGEMTVKVVRTFNGFCNVEGSGYEPKGRISCSGVNIENLLEMLAAHTFSDVKLVNEKGVWSVKGSPTEGALLVLAYKGLGEEGVGKAVNKLQLVKTYPFDRFRKRKSTVHIFNGKYIVVVSGAPEILVELSNTIQVGDGVKPFDNDSKKKVLGYVEELASQGYRTLGVAFKVVEAFSEEDSVENVERDLTFYAVLGIIDPPREGVAEAVQIAKRAGIKTIIVTGDHKLTAMAIAKMIGLDVDNSIALEGRDLDRMSDDELAKIIDKVTVFARVTPEHKARIVKVLKKKSYRVAMTGDGVNDAPALKEAHIGIAMGIRGTDVAKEAAQLVLLDDNYSTIVEAVKEGRVIYENLKKPINYLLTANMGEVATVFGSQLLLMPPPLEPVHLLWINVVTDALPAAALGLEPPEPGIVERPPRSAKERFVTRRKLVYYIVMGSLLGAATLLIFNMFRETSLQLARTAAFTAIALSEFGRAISSRSENQNFWKLPRNKWLLPALLASMAMQLIAIYTPLNKYFHVVPLDWWIWPAIFIAPATILIVDEVRKVLGIKIS
ncbi:cation-transporting P-type ATPase [Ignisphaera sp. 4213-co]|uniref:Cation-transporting P-type ATPase n=1 Tax=Ignisphaera cupida TaxID=3050454 RepID=A0ABD4Z7S6_9CREN|nr:cation-transporting P-type ATPase [Ignisphaera sp. 4213-co]MDK6028978.1 cation-transporting P-type ATPase [Ignisphaera sp. 4213-co]